MSGIYDKGKSKDFMRSAFKGLGPKKSRSKRKKSKGANPFSGMGGINGKPKQTAGEAKLSARMRALDPGSASGSKALFGGAKRK